MRGLKCHSEGELPNAFGQSLVGLISLTDDSVVFFEPLLLRTLDGGSLVFQCYLGEGEAGSCRDFKDLLEKYNETVRRVVLSGPTSFAPIIRRAMRHVVESNNIFHILVIIADGQMEDEAATVSAIVEASKLPLSIVLVGVGDGPWDVMEQFDDHIRGREFDNFQFVDFHSIREARNPEAAFALAALMEVPLQYQAMMELGYFDENLSS